MICTPATRHCVFLRQAQAGQCFSGIEYGCRCASNGIGITARQRRGARQRLQKIQSTALGAQQSAGVRGDRAHARVGSHEVAFPKLKWTGWSNVNDAGQNTPLRPIVLTAAAAVLAINLFNYIDRYVLAAVSPAVSRNSR